MRINPLPPSAVGRHGRQDQDNNVVPQPSADSRQTDNINNKILKKKT